MNYVIGQAAEVIEEGNKFADRFGFEALVAILLLIGVGWLAREALMHWKSTTERLAASQEITWQQQIKISEENLTLSRETQKMFGCLTESTAAMEKTLAALSKTGTDRTESIAVVHSKTNQVHFAIQNALVAFSKKLSDSDPHVAKELERIACDMREIERHGS